MYRWQERQTGNEPVKQLNYYWRYQRWHMNSSNSRPYFSCYAQVRLRIAALLYVSVLTIFVTPNLTRDTWSLPTLSQSCVFRRFSSETLDSLNFMVLAGPAIASLVCRITTFAIRTSELFRYVTLVVIASTLSLRLSSRTLLQSLA